MMSDETELAVEPEKQMELCGEPKSPYASKGKLSVVLLSVKQEEEGESYSGTSFESMEDGFQGMMTDEPEEFAVEPKKQKKHHGEPRSPFKRSSVALLSMKQERDGESHLGASSVSMEDDNQKAIAMSPLGMMPPKPPSVPEETNADIKHQLRKEIRQFGRKYEKIFKLLKEVQRPPEVRKQLVEFAIKEAARFKRGHLIKHLEIILEKIDSDHFLNKDTCIPNIYGHDQ